MVFADGSKRDILNTLTLLEDIDTEDKFQIGLINSFVDENITLAHDVYRGLNPLVAIYIDEDGITYRFNRNNMTAENVMEWISKKQYLSAPLKYKTPALLGDYMKYWAYFKKDVRKWYRTKL